MDSEDRVDAVHYALFYSYMRAFGDFLGGLEDELDVSAECLAVLVEDLQRADQHRGVRVVSAGVHPALVLRGEGQPSLLVYRQRVDVGAEEHRLAGLSALYFAYYS